MRGRVRPQRSKGFATGTNWCYINAALQALMHQPQLLNWLQNHDRPVRRGTGGNNIRNACHANPPLYWGAAAGNAVPDCTGCMMRDLVNTYWANTPNATVAPNMPRIQGIALAGDVAQLAANGSMIQMDSNDFYQVILQRLQVASA